ncbi:hypothetical protein [Arthrobacter woluwensis]|uniref:Uncharacterized protein n=1 Tax=Arthrobacter woluwensis TaxID=156980 RepID=A0A1H4VQG8_9MICC|nr:hypothetical protein [Arthrobacter woluwensis]SEC83277.1 hypothetical protein SAMN04489745_3284 [Arthrobacter woluwensis]
MTARGARFARGWVAATAATSIAAFSHVLAGGAVPAAAVLLLSLVLSGLVCTVLAGKTLLTGKALHTGSPLSLWRLSAGVLFSQALFHGLFSMAPAGMTAGTTAGMTTMPAATMAHDMARMGHAGHAARSMAPVPGSVATDGSMALMDHSSPLMWLGHVVAAVFTIAVLRHGEVTLLKLLAALRMRLLPVIPRVAPLVVVPGSLTMPLDRRVTPLRNLGVPLLVMRHRGPPLLSESF